MKFEKITENKIRVTLDILDLEKNDITINSFILKSEKTQQLFFNLLEQARREIGFNTTDCKVKIEALTADDDKFMLHITKLEDLSIKTPLKPKIKTKIKTFNKEDTYLYEFLSFDNYCDFIKLLSKSSYINNLDFAKNISLYNYKSKFYLVLDNVNEECDCLTFFNSIIIEYSKYVTTPHLFLSKVKEEGKCFIKNNAIINSLNYYNSNDLATK